MASSGAAKPPQDAPHGTPEPPRPQNPLTRGRGAAPASVPPTPPAPAGKAAAQGVSPRPRRGAGERIRPPEPPRSPPDGGRGRSTPPIPPERHAPPASPPPAAPPQAGSPPINPLTGRATPPLQAPWTPPDPVYGTGEELLALLDEHERDTPSLPIVLVSAAMGLGGAVVGFYFGWELLNWRVEASVALAVLLLCAGVGLSGALLSAATRSRAAVANIAFSCGVVLLTLIFFGLCGVVGGLAATLLVAAGT